MVVMTVLWALSSRLCSFSLPRQQQQLTGSELHTSKLGSPLGDPYLIILLSCKVVSHQCCCDKSWTAADAGSLDVAYVQLTGAVAAVGAHCSDSELLSQGKQVLIKNQSKQLRLPMLLPASQQVVQT